VWFYDLSADGWSLDDKRTALLPDDKLGPRPSASLTNDEYSRNNLPDALERWKARDGLELMRARSEQSFSVPKADITANGYDLSLNATRKSFIKTLSTDFRWRLLRSCELEGNIQRGIEELKAILS